MLGGYKFPQVQLLLSKDPLLAPAVATSGALFTTPQRDQITPRPGELRTTADCA